jgi:hypothetical protein
MFSFSFLNNRRLDSNALICDCQILWLAKMLNEKQGTTLAAAICQSPDQLVGRSVTSLIEEFNCSNKKISLLKSNFFFLILTQKETKM